MNVNFISNRHVTTVSSKLVGSCWGIYVEMYQLMCGLVVMCSFHLSLWVNIIILCLYFIRKEAEQASKRKLQYKFKYVLMIAKTYKKNKLPKRGKKKNGRPHSDKDIIFVNMEEELFYKVPISYVLVSDISFLLLTGVSIEWWQKSNGVAVWSVHSSEHWLLVCFTSPIIVFFSFVDFLVLENPSKIVCIFLKVCLPVELRV